MLCFSLLLDEENNPQCRRYKFTLFIKKQSCDNNILSLLFVGECSAAQIEAIQDLHPENMINCHLRFKDQNLDIPASEVFSANIDFDFDSGKYR